MLFTAKKKMLLHFVQSSTTTSMFCNLIRKQNADYVKTATLDIHGNIKLSLVAILIPNLAVVYGLLGHQKLCQENQGTLDGVYILVHQRSTNLQQLLVQIWQQIIKLQVCSFVLFVHNLMQNDSRTYKLLMAERKMTFTRKIE